MSIHYLKRIFAQIEHMDSISVQVLRVINTKEGTHYDSREIEIQPDEELSTHLAETGIKYTDEKFLNSIGAVDDYQGDIVKGNVYKLSIHNELISDYFNNLDSTVANPNTEADVVGRSWNALIIKGTVELDDEDQQIMLVSMKSPVSVLTNKYIGLGRGEFKKIKDPILTLNHNLDAVIVGDTFYMLTMQAENLFNMERSYKIRCNAKVDEIIESGILSNAEAFKNIATKGQNPRRFVSFNETRLIVLKERSEREKYLSLFKIPLKADGTIDTEADKAADRLVRFLCDKAMLDPIDEEPREVSAAKAWS